MADWPKAVPKPDDPQEVVQVLMTEDMARRFEERCLGPNTRGNVKLQGPMIFQEDDLPTYIIG